MIMKKNVFKLLTVACVSLAMFSCEDEFLVREPGGATNDGNNSIINADQLSDAIDLNPELGEATVTGIYSTMVATGTGGTTSQQDFGQKGYDIYGDMMCSDMALSTSTYGWYRSRVAEYQAMEDFTQQENYQVWRYYFRIISLANLVLDNFGGDEMVPETDANKALFGQALALRAHSYFYLTQYMINDVEASWTQPTLPIYRTFEQIGKPKSTTEEVYQLMEEDLTRAITLLDGYNRPTKLQINKSIAQTILAYVLSSTRDRWPEVATLTSDALAGSGASLMTPDATVNGILGGFNNVASNGWMWGIDLNEDIGLSLVSWWGQIDAFSYSYAAVGDNKAMDDGLYASIRPDDVRRDQFLDDPASTRHLQPLFKFYDSDRVIFGSSQIVKADYVFMRYAEPLLLHIEALAKSGQEGAAKTMLQNNFLSQRVTDPSYVSGLSSQGLLDEIYLQTRIEFWGEGKSYLAMKRNMATVTRGSNHLSFGGQSFAFDDEKMTFEIPSQEIQDNLFINSQN